MTAEAQSMAGLIPLIGESLGLDIRDAVLNTSALTPYSENIFGRTNIGSLREKNQDAISAFILGKKKPLLVLSVADGLGCYLYSEQAAYRAVNLVPQYLAQGFDIEDSFQKAHHDLIKHFPYALKADGKNSDLNNKDDWGSTTLVMAVIAENNLNVAYAGDARCYLIRNKKIISQTEDHSAINLLIKSGAIPDDPKVIRRHPLRSVVLNSLGNPEEKFDLIVDGKKYSNRIGSPSLCQWELQKNDIIFLASDGCYANLSKDLLESLSSLTLPEADGLVQFTLEKAFSTGKTSWNERPSRDNYSYIIYKHS